MKAIPVTRPATITDVLQPDATLPASMKKKAVAANIPIEITQNEIPTKSSCINIVASAAIAIPENPIRAIAAKANSLSFFIKNSLFVSFYFSLYKLDLSYLKPILWLDSKLN